MQSICVAYLEITCHFRFAASVVACIAAGTVTISFGAPSGPQLDPVGVASGSQAGSVGARKERLGVKRAKGSPFTDASVGFGHIAADCAWHPPVPSGWISVV